MRNAARAARHVGARGPATACPAIRFSFCSAPRESVIAPAQSVTMWSKAHGRVRDATRPATNAKVRCIRHLACVDGTTRIPLCLAPLFPSPRWPIRPILSAVGAFSSCPLPWAALHCLFRPSHPSRPRYRHCPPQEGVSHLLCPPLLVELGLCGGSFIFIISTTTLGCLSPALPSSVLTFLRPTSLSQRILESTCPRVNTIRVSSDSHSFC